MKLNKPLGWAFNNIPDWYQHNRELIYSNLNSKQKNNNFWAV